MFFSMLMSHCCMQRRRNMPIVYCLFHAPNWLPPCWFLWQLSLTKQEIQITTFYEPYYKARVITFWIQRNREFHLCSHLENFLNIYYTRVRVVVVPLSTLTIHTSFQVTPLHWSITIIYYTLSSHVFRHGHLFNATNLRSLVDLITHVS